jgi:hypothetical protein
VNSRYVAMIVLRCALDAVSTSRAIWPSYPACLLGLACAVLRPLAMGAFSVVPELTGAKQPANGQAGC